MNRLSIVATLAVITGLLGVAGWSAAGANGSLLHEASLKSGDYGTGATVNTMAPDHGGSPGVLGIVDSAEGVTYTSTEADNQSNALINFVISSSTDRLQFLSTGTVSFMLKANRATHVGGEIFGDNYGFTSFRNGQGASGATATRKLNGDGIEDDQVLVNWKTLAGGVWDWRDAVTLEYDQWYHIGFAWGGSGENYETWVCGILRAEDSGNSLPWGVANSATNVGLGDNHERGYDQYNSAVGVTFADIQIWNEYRPKGGTRSCHMVYLPVVLNNH
jgi:hypothetical protein